METFLSKATFAELGPWAIWITILGLAVSFGKVIWPYTKDYLERQMRREESALESWKALATQSLLEVASLRQQVLRSEEDCAERLRHLREDYDKRLRDFEDLYHGLQRQFMAFQASVVNQFEKKKRPDNDDS